MRLVALALLGLAAIYLLTRPQRYVPGCGCSACRQWWRP